MASALLSRAAGVMQRLTSVSRLGGQQLVQRRPVATRAAGTRATASFGKKDLVEAVRLKVGLDNKHAEAAVNSVLETIMETVAKGAGAGGRSG